MHQRLATLVKTDKCSPQDTFHVTASCIHTPVNTRMYGGYETNSYKSELLETRSPLVYLRRLMTQTCNSMQACCLINLHHPML